MPIALSQKEWERIKKRTSPDKEDPEAVRRREYVNFLNTASREMTKTWPNSVENVNRRNEELRLARIEAAEQANTIFYKRYLRKKKEKQEQLMYSARDIMFKSSDAPKLLLTAVIETAVQKERIEQINFLNELRRQEAENKRKNDDHIIQQAKEWNELNELRRKRRFEVNKQHQKEILEQAHEVAERNRKAYETELNLQKIDNINASAEIDAMKEFDKDFKEREKIRIFKDMEQAKAETITRKKEQAARDKMDDRLIEVLNKSRARIERRRKQTELDVKNEKLRVLEAISNKLQSGDAEREAKEEAILQKAIKEKRDLEDARNEAQTQKNLKNKQERIALREKFLRDEEQRIHEFNTRRQFEIMNRFKNAELFKEFKENMRRVKNRKVKDYRADILKLWKEREEREARELAAKRYFYGELAEKKIRDADNKLLTHASHLLAEAKEHGRPDFAIRRAIDKYCKMYRLYPMPPLYEPIAEHMRHYEPKDESRPDPNYVYPPPPQSTADDGDESLQLGDKRDGLQGTENAGPSKQTTNKPQEDSDDYKKAGPANGLQRRNSKNDLSLPPIAMVPCKNPDCHCELKPKDS
ncbi:unnamed protein product [Arctia plantaginis]|uniref:Trichohyalin-plectin-homology domain-containing protein n=1 Tax=Arctia plantaginis TaxID=874455 RepID=A0A8S0ZGL3_ARCPL|nr:unnamed protein product [Arctia plantaginis]